MWRSIICVPELESLRYAIDTALSLHRYSITSPFHTLLFHRSDTTHIWSDVPLKKSKTPPHQHQLSFYLVQSQDFSHHLFFILSTRSLDVWKYSPRPRLFFIAASPYVELCTVVYPPLWSLPSLLMLYISVRMRYVNVSCPLPLSYLYLLLISRRYVFFFRYNNTPPSISFIHTRVR